MVRLVSRLAVLGLVTRFSHATPDTAVVADSAAVTTDSTAAARAAVYDYIVIGSGPGGGTVASNLARAGWSTLLIEAGDNASGQPATEVEADFVTTGIPDNLHWDFWVRHYANDTQQKRYQKLVWKLPNGDHWVGPGSSAPAGAVMLGVEYPRGATLGGSSIINAGCTVLPSDSDWNYIGAITGDGSWK
jgi:choline dehydrogenase